jgi:hypothetical protein
MINSAFGAKLSGRKKTIFLVWLTLVTLYILYVVSTDALFEWLTFSIITYTGLLPLIMINYNEELMQSKVDDAVAHFTVTGDKVVIGDDQVPIVKVKRVAIEVVDDYGYCSLPFNHMSPGVVPSFIFPKEQYEDLKKHVVSKLPKVQIIK